MHTPMYQFIQVISIPNTLIFSAETMLPTLLIVIKLIVMHTLLLTYLIHIGQLTSVFLYFMTFIISVVKHYIALFKTKISIIKISIIKPPSSLQKLTTTNTEKFTVSMAMVLIHPLIKKRLVNDDIDSREEEDDHINIAGIGADRPPLASGGAPQPMRGSNSLDIFPPAQNLLPLSEESLLA